MKDSEKPSGDSFPLTRNSGSTVTQTPKRKTANKGPIFTNPRSAWTYTRWAFLSLFCLVSAMGGTVAGNFYWKSAVIRSIVQGMISQPFATMRGDMLASYDPALKFPAQHTMNVVLLGCDADYENARPVVIKNAQTRSDAILIAHVDFDAQTINVLSIPRDTAVDIPRHGYNKINAAHAIGGPELSQETIKSAFGIDTDYYLTLNFEGFVKVVDALGGVDLNVHKNLNYDDNWGNLHVHLKPGEQHLNGYKAMGYVRIRHSDDDIQRTLRQQEFLEALRSKVKSPSTIMKLPDALNAILDSIKSNMTQGQMITLANFARKLPRENIQVATLPCIEGPSYVFMKPRESESVIRKLFYNDDSFAIVNVQTPGRQVVQRLNLRSTRKRRFSHRGGGGDTSGPKDDDGQPLNSEPDTPLVTGDKDAPQREGRREPGPTDPPASTDKTTPQDENKTGSGDSPDAGTDTPDKSSDPAPDDKTPKPDKETKSGKTGKTGKGGKKDPAPPPAPPKTDPDSTAETDSGAKR